MNYFIVTTNGREATRDTLSHYGKVGEPKFVHEVVILETDYTKDDILTITGVESVDDDEEVEPDATQHSPDGWHLPWISETDDKYVYNRTGKGVNAYVVDLGVMLDHEDFEDRATTVYTYDDKDYDPDQNVGWHGTACASQLGGKEFGVAKEVTLLNVRTKPYASGMVKSLEKVIEHHETTDRNSVVSMSMSSPSNIYQKVVQAMVNRGICVVTSAGNEGDKLPRFPARNEEVISVGAVTRYNKISGFSNRGADIYAPGSTTRSANIVNDSSNRFFTGTSASTPMVAGVLCMIVEGSDRFNSYDDVKWAREQLFEYAKEFDFGYGLSSNVENDTREVQKPSPLKNQTKNEDESDNKKKIIIGVIATVVIGVVVYFSL